MAFYYLSFCDVTKAKGEQFLGATVVEANDEKHAQSRATELGINPGGEIAISLLRSIKTPDDIPEEGRKYLHTFVPRDVVMAEGAGTPDPSPTMVCQDCNPTTRH